MTRIIAPALLLAACHAAPAPAPEPQPRTPCTLEHLMAFDPGSEVAERRALPPIEQRIAAQTAHLAIIPCQRSESDAACRARAEREVAAHYPGSLRSEIGFDRYHLRVRYHLDGAPREAVFADIDELRTHLAEQLASGHQVLVVDGQRIPAADAERHAIVHASGRDREALRKTLRVALTLSPPPDPVVAMLVLQARAARAHIDLHTYTPQEDGSVHIELGCVHAISNEPPTGVTRRSAPARAAGPGSP